MRRYYDISMTIREGMITYPGSPPTRVRPHERIAEGDDANVTALSFGSHTGTHVDAAHHFVDGGQTVDALPLERLIGPARVVHIPPRTRAIGPDELSEFDLAGEERVLLRTGNSELLERDDFAERFAHLTGAGARFLAEQGVRLVGIDYLSIEAFDADEPEAHRTLLEREIIVVEGLDLRDVPEGRYELLCLPLRIGGIDGAPARAVLRSLP
jgi:arylformamidase